VNFVDPWGNLIYLSGKNPEADFIMFKDVFRKLGHSDIDKKMIMRKDAKGQLYIDLVGGKGTLQEKVSVNVTQNKNYKKWLNRYTVDLKNRPDIYNQELEKIFEWLILDRNHAAIDFRSGEKYHAKDKLFWFDIEEAVSRKGGGVTVEPFETENGHVEVVVDPEHYSVTIDVGRKLPLDISTIVVHEFGHALANMLGYYGELLYTKLDFMELSKSKEPLFTEVAVMFENLWRLRLNQTWLRGWHAKMESKMEVE